MRDTMDSEAIARVARGAVQFFAGKRRGTGSPREQIALLSDVQEDIVRRVFEEHWSIPSISNPRLNMTKQQYERIQAEAVRGVTSPPSATSSGVIELQPRSRTSSP